ncbi:uncharacterized protein LOC126903029 [Daktulosphaira vitifoliae]|uniref:uncharacterized protein LOC126903029 n=1 Tax=Daktulosphaira vitifoliae TaxID=58002 RepID=UPI0021AB0938|nr:uncharacterized protein LOC126903029 [Daktulosphaira vitifoliae]
MSKTYEIGFIGAGSMAKAIGLGFVSKGVVKAEDIIVSAPSENNKAPWRNKGVTVTNDNNQVFSSCKILFLAVKPQHFSYVVSKLNTKNEGIPIKIIVSIMAGIPCKKLNEIFILNSNLNLAPSCVFKVMPNTPSLIGEGFSVICHESCAIPEELSLTLPKVISLMSAIGKAEVIPESLMDAAGALSGCGPAYTFLIIEALVDGAVKQGIPRNLAVQLAASTLAGSSRMVLETGKHTAELKDMVTSAGGSTIAALHALEKGGVRSALMDAIEAATKRSKEMADKP